MCDEKKQRRGTGRRAERGAQIPGIPPPPLSFAFASGFLHALHDPLKITVTTPGPEKTRQCHSASGSFSNPWIRVRFSRKHLDPLPAAGNSTQLLPLPDFFKLTVVTTL